MNLKSDLWMTSTAALLAVIPILAVQADQPTLVLEDFDQADVASRIETRETEATVIEQNGGGAIRVVSGTGYAYPNVRIAAPGGAWDLGAYTQVQADVTNLGEAAIRIGMRIDNPKATGRKNSNTGGGDIAPGETATISADIDREFATELRDSLEGMQHTPWGVRGNWGGRIDPSNVIELNFFLNKPDESHTFIIDNVRAVGRFDPESQVVPEPFFPFIDRFGQYIHADWPGKIHEESDLTAAAEREAAEVVASPRPASWDKYGGWAEGPKLEATGHFYAAKHDGRWHLVDPEGHLFFSMGIDVVQMRGSTVIDQGRDDWFADAPWQSGDPAMQAMLDTTEPKRTEYKGNEAKTFAFYEANLMRKYGPDYRQKWLQTTPKRLMNWGVNTIGCWSDAELFTDTSIPYAHWVFINSAKLPWQPGTRNAISDPWNPMFETELTRRITNMTKRTTDDPWCIGYFLDNELSWGDESHLARGLLKAKPKQVAKQKMFDWLESKYTDIAALNEAWGVAYASWDAAVQGESDPKTDAAKDDLTAFNAQIVEAYFSTVSAKFKQIAPHKLYLGCRFAEYNPQVVAAAEKYCDVVSFNLYRYTLDGWRPSAEFDKPVIVGEFHFGAGDRGVFGLGLRSAQSTQDKADKLSHYVETAVYNPLIVGCHWFQLMDEPASGRPSDAENHGIGFLSITDTPHDAVIEATRGLAGSLYQPID